MSDWQSWVSTRMVVSVVISIPTGFAETFLKSPMQFYAKMTENVRFVI